LPATGPVALQPESSPLRRCHDRIDDLVQGRAEFFQTRTWDNDGIAAPMRLFGDAQKSAAFVFAELDVKMFALDLQLLRGDNVIHGGYGEKETLGGDFRPTTTSLEQGKARTEVEATSKLYSSFKATHVPASAATSLR
jgi:hypothetical protein